MVVLVLGIGVLVGTALSPWWVLLLPLEDSFMPGRLLAGLGWVGFFFGAAFALSCPWWLKPNPWSQMWLTLSSSVKLWCYGDLQAGWKACLLHCICPGGREASRWEVSCCPLQQCRDALAMLASCLKGCAGLVCASTAPSVLPGLPG